MTGRLLGGIEAGGTKVVCAVGTGPDVVAETRFATTTPAATIARAIAFFTQQSPLAALGIASFGPIDLDRRSPTYGFITTTPKPGWADTDIVGPLRRALGVPIAFDTDVNAAALAEQRWGAARDVASVVYVTVGTGIGGMATPIGTASNMVALNILNKEKKRLSFIRFAKRSIPLTIIDLLIANIILLVRL